MKVPAKVLKTMLAGGILMAMLPAVFSLGATESKAESVSESTRSTEQPDSDEEQNKIPESNQISKTGLPQAENLKNRELGAAFRRFRPSEAISTDNAVPFPVDI